MKKFIGKAFIEKRGEKMVAIATDETIDRHGESLPIDAWDLKNFKKNPVLQWAHDYYSPPVGIAKNIRRDGDTLVFEPVFHEITQMAREVKRMFEEGIMNCFSVGFLPHADGKNGEKVRLELLEISAVPVPANPSARVIEKSIGDITEDDKKAITLWIEEEAEEKATEEVVETVSEELDEQKKREEKWLKIRQVDQVVSAFWKVYMDPTTEVDKFSELLKETAGILTALAESGNVTAGKNLKDFSGSVIKEFENIEIKQGRVLSKKNRGTIESAISALQEVLSADTDKEEEKKIEPQVIKIETEKDSNQNPKGRDRQLTLNNPKVVETLMKQIGFIARAVKKP